jgi:hypothetical protein
MMERIGAVWSAVENRIGVMLGCVALGRLLWVAIQVHEGKRRWQVSLLLVETLTVIAAYIMANATISILPVIVMLFVDRQVVISEDVQQAIALLWGWLGLHGAQFFVVRFLQKRGILPEESKPSTPKPSVGA